MVVDFRSINKIFDYVVMYLYENIIFLLNFFLSILGK